MTTDTAKRYQAFARDEDGTLYPVNAADDWVPGNALIQEGSWHIDADGDIAFEWEGETEMCWDGAVTGTRDGFLLYNAEDGNLYGVPENELVLLEVDEDGEIVDPGAPVAFTARRSKLRFNDPSDMVAVREALVQLVAAARDVVANWESGDLAGAVANLDGVSLEIAGEFGIEIEQEEESENA